MSDTPDPFLGYPPEPYRERFGAWHEFLCEDGGRYLWQWCAEYGDAGSGPGWRNGQAIMSPVSFHRWFGRYQWQGIAATPAEVRALVEYRQSASNEIATLYFRLGQATGAWSAMREALTNLLQMLQARGNGLTPAQLSHPAVSNAIRELARQQKATWLPEPEKDGTDG